MFADSCLIILAAGNSFRMGTCKFLLPAQGGLSWLETLVNTTQELQISTVIVVNQKNYTACKKMLGNRENVDYTVNNSPDNNRYFSVKLGLISAGEKQYYFIHNADCPHLNINTLKEIYSQKKVSDVVIPTYQQKGGHPVLINNEVKKHLISQPDECRLDVELKKFNQLRVEVKEASVVLDLDTMEEYQKYLHTEFHAESF